MPRQEYLALQLSKIDPHTRIGFRMEAFNGEYNSRNLLTSAPSSETLETHPYLSRTVSTIRSNERSFKSCRTGRY
ncbi:protein of unknown function [Georgfuchsia toluolica]|uniref:Uncharacterized protein n=1 Tax=Georgfuchsia toluolica TaxID=424218 RepID=A0A916NHX1_9PROT|nr:protein of unknown function [Georgfuchsia toluolica]